MATDAPAPRTEARAATALPLPEHEVTAQATDVLRALVRLLGQATVRAGEGQLTLTQFSLLRRLAARTWLTAELASDLGLTPPTVSAAVDHMVRRGLVERVPTQVDRRTVPLRATRAGRDVLDRAYAAQQQALQAVLQALTARERRGLALALPGLARLMAQPPSA